MVQKAEPHAKAGNYRGEILSFKKNILTIRVIQNKMDFLEKVSNFIILAIYKQRLYGQESWILSGGFLIWTKLS